MDLQVNSKPIFLKRVAADGFDIASLFVLFMLLNILLSNTALFATYRRHVENYQRIEQEVLRDNDAQEVNKVLQSDEEYQSEVFAALLHSCLVRMLIGFIGEVLLYLIIPLANKDGLTVGKILAGVMLFDETRQSKALKKQIFARFVIIVLASAALYPWTGIYTFLLYPVLRFIFLITNKKKKSLCDYLTRTMYIDRLSYSSI